MLSPTKNANPRHQGAYRGHLCLKLFSGAGEGRDRIEGRGGRVRPLKEVEVPGFVFIPICQAP